VTSILGIDLSSTQLDGCLLLPGKAPILRRETLGKATEPLIERLRRVYRAMWNMNPITDEFGSPNADYIVIEDAFGRFRKADRAMHMVIGAIIVSAPSESQVMLLSPGDWRTAIGAKNTKQSGHEYVWKALCEWPRPGSYPDDEHTLDSIGVALGARAILASQDTALEGVRGGDG
jgi:hypothetical protein